MIPERRRCGTRGPNFKAIRPVQEKNPFEKYAGVLSAFHFEGELDAWLSDLRDEDTTDQ